VSLTLWLDPSTKPLLRAHHIACISGASVQSHSHSRQTVPAFHWPPRPDSVHPAMYQTEHSVLTLRSAPACGLPRSTYCLNYPFRSWLLITVEPPHGGRRSTPTAVLDIDDVVDSRFSTFTFTNSSFVSRKSGAGERNNDERMFAFTRQRIVSA
jgi:hypothetical protein